MEARRARRSDDQDSQNNLASIPLRRSLKPRGCAADEDGVSSFPGLKDAMIQLTRLNNSRLAINSDLIKFVEAARIRF